MSASLSPPWILGIALELLQDKLKPSVGSRHMNKPQVCQVVGVKAALRAIEVSDTLTTCFVFLTDKAILGLGHMPLSSLKNSLIKLERWHYSTVLHCAADRPFKSYTDHGPIAIQCSALKSFGCEDLLILGNPTSLNKDTGIMTRLKFLKLYSAAKLLAVRQFGADSLLPGPTGEPSHPIYVRNLRREDALIPAHQQMEMEEFRRSFPDMSHTHLLEFRASYVPKTDLDIRHLSLVPLRQEAETLVEMEELTQVEESIPPGQEAETSVEMVELTQVEGSPQTLSGEKRQREQEEMRPKRETTIAKHGVAVETQVDSQFQTEEHSEFSIAARSLTIEFLDEQHPSSSSSSQKQLRDKHINSEEEKEVVLCTPRLTPYTPISFARPAKYVVDYLRYLRTARFDTKDYDVASVHKPAAMVSPASFAQPAKYVEMYLKRLRDSRRKSCA
jgi:hypothetical protein